MNWKISLDKSCLYACDQEYSIESKIGIQIEKKNQNIVPT